jgi:MerR family copper efflux transcriptional regulator
VGLTKNVHEPLSTLLTSIGQVARQAGVGVETVRFYEREGVLAEPPRRACGYRQYSEQVVKRILFIKGTQKLGFSLKDITEFLMLGVDEQACLEEVKLRIEVKLAGVEQKVVELLCLRQALLEGAMLCTREGPGSRCPLLDALDQQAFLAPAGDQTE